jgi:hypothetical protein
METCVRKKPLVAGRPLVVRKEDSREVLLLQRHHWVQLPRGVYVDKEAM